MAIDLVTDGGVFAARRIDPGTRILLALAPRPPAAGEIMDLGCGYGPIALALGRRAPAARIWAVDINQRALELVRLNVKRLGIDNVRACRPDDVPDDLRLTAIYSNPPVRIGKPALQSLLTHWLRRLAPAGRAFLVVHKHLGGDSLAGWIGERGYATRRIGSQGGFRVLEVSPVSGA
jgi:16S rRNA G1207 methylase RsmC